MYNRCKHLPLSPQDRFQKCILHGATFKFIQKLKQVQNSADCQFTRILFLETFDTSVFESALATSLALDRN